MGYYTMRACLVRTLYGDSNTLVPGIRKRAAHKTKAITKVYEDRWSKGHEIAYTLHKLSSSPILGARDCSEQSWLSEEEGSLSMRLQCEVVEEKLMNPLSHPTSWCCHEEVAMAKTEFTIYKSRYKGFRETKHVKSRIRFLLPLQPVPACVDKAQSLYPSKRSSLLRECTHKKKAIMKDDSYKTMEMHRIITSLAPSSLGTCYLDKQLQGERSDTFRDYLREIQVESQAV
ncbi:hypothetical protein F2Q69_00013349 [Brassica cretica]|uniref:Uncharacterized protein n=1 Tax=Brassica cretica TaxID=69181 RepID=A0A8S9QXI7_BRACR|nr:hypothetical protein F2Q69_00013349 [Brassica cretica]